MVTLLIKKNGFTLIELLVVLAVIMLMTGLVAPRYFSGIDHAKEAALKQDLTVVREAIDKYYGDKSRYPDSLAELAEKKYIRHIPIDPLTDKDNTWVIVPPGDNIEGQMYDIHSGAEGLDKDGKPYADW